MYEKYEELLKTKGLKNSEVCKGAGVSRSTISEWKNGKHDPSKETLKRIADFTGVTVDYFLSDNLDKAWEEHKESINNLSKDDLIDMLVESLFESANIAMADAKEAYRNEMRVFSDYLLARIEKDGNKHED